MSKKFDERRKSGSLEYILESKDMLYSIGVEILKDSNMSNFIECLKIPYRGTVKLIYDISNYETLEELLPNLSLKKVVNIFNNLIRIVLSIKSNGYIQVQNVAMNFSRVFIDVESLNIYLIYIPIDEQKKDFKLIEKRLKKSISIAIMKNKGLMNPTVMEFFKYVNDEKTTLIEVKQFIEKRFYDMLEKEIVIQKKDIERKKISIKKENNLEENYIEQMLNSNVKVEEKEQEDYIEQMLNSKVKMKEKEQEDYYIERMLNSNVKVEEKEKEDYIEQMINSKVKMEGKEQEDYIEQMLNSKVKMEEKGQEDYIEKMLNNKILIEEEPEKEYIEQMLNSKVKTEEKEIEKNYKEQMLNSKVKVEKKEPEKEYIEQMLNSKVTETNEKISDQKHIELQNILKEDKSKKDEIFIKKILEECTSLEKEKIEYIQNMLQNNFVLQNKECIEQETSNKEQKNAEKGINDNNLIKKEIVEKNKIYNNEQKIYKGELSEKFQNQYENKTLQSDKNISIKGKYNDEHKKIETIKENVYKTREIFLKGIESVNGILIKIEENEAIIGSKPGVADIVIGMNKTISRKHCKILKIMDKVYIIDLGSTNGTFVNGVKLEEQQMIQINEDDIIRISNARFVVKYMYN